MGFCIGTALLSIQTSTLDPNTLSIAQVIQILVRLKNVEKWGKMGILSENRFRVRLMFESKPAVRVNSTIIKIITNIQN
jgi:nanoRNase/pAp phosphatase (c-di-AMP/oligoRNAs hydrolase)